MRRLRNSAALVLLFAFVVRISYAFVERALPALFAITIITTMLSLLFIPKKLR